jgi:hypothetical protein
MMPCTPQAPYSEDERIWPAHLSSIMPAQSWPLTSYMLEMQDGMFLQNVHKFLTDHFASQNTVSFRVLMWEPQIWNTVFNQI